MFGGRPPSRRDRAGVGRRRRRRPPTPASDRRAPRPAGCDRRRAIVVERYGGPEVLQFSEVGLPPPARARCGSATRRSASTSSTSIAAPAISTCSAARRAGHGGGRRRRGVGPGVAGLSPSATASPMPARRSAPMPSAATCRAELLVPLPDDISDETAAAGLLKGVTASFLLHDVHRSAGRGRAGPCRRRRRRPAPGAMGAASRRDGDRHGLERRQGADRRRLGADACRSSTRARISSTQCMRLTAGRGADVVYDAVGSDTFAGSLAALGSPRPPGQLRPGLGAGRQLGHRPASRRNRSPSRGRTTATSPIRAKSCCRMSSGCLRMLRQAPADDRTADALSAGARRRRPSRSRRPPHDRVAGAGPLAVSTVWPQGQRGTVYFLAPEELAVCRLAQGAKSKLSPAPTCLCEPSGASRHAGLQNKSEAPGTVYLFAPRASFR